jgi:hypothetical protein
VVVEGFGALLFVDDAPDELLELPQPATSTAAANRAARVPTLMVCAFPGLRYGTEERNPTFCLGAIASRSLPPADRDGP